ncbi:hypothetical protein [Chloroflexus sp.]|uniref:hypothetical protein n=1 Tax=Chloroflexus sp. TaxID=1904827 RepID=UPI00298F29E9|nr:hypothetical protein [Chloroflexus sp.]MDW8405907.1 hypothetical protein [Chloroflexus sp.]
MDIALSLIPILLTLLVFSRIVGDTPAFRFVQYLFVGVSLGYAVVVIYHQVLRPAVIDLLAASGQPALATLRLIPFVLAALLLTRVSGQQTNSWLANIPLALVFGVGAALVVGGALIGTILPQVLDATRQDFSSLAAVLGSVVLLIGSIVTLLSFTLTRSPDPNRQRWIDGAARVGRWVLLLAFGFFLAGSISSYLAALNERLLFIVEWVRAILGT